MAYNKVLSGALRAAVTFVLIAVLMYIMRDSLPDVLNTLKLTSPHLFALSAAVYFASVLIASLRLRVVLGLQNIRMTIAETFRVNLIGCFFSGFLPTSIGGDFAKAIYISKKSKKNTQSYTSVFIDRFLGMFTLFLIAMTAMMFTAGNTPGPYLAWLFPVFTAISMMFIFILYNKEFAKKLLPIMGFVIPQRFTHDARNIYNAMHGYKHHKKEIAYCFALSLTGQIVAFSAVYFLGLGINSHIPFKTALLAMPISSIASLLPSINGTGPREMSIVMILRPIIGSSAAGAIAFLWLGIILLTYIAGGIVYLFAGRYKINASNLPA